MFKLMIRKNSPDFTVLLILAIVIAFAGVWISFDGKQYWHDVRFLYLASEFSFNDILAGRFNPDQAWTASNEASVSGFYQSKIGHLYLLKKLITSIGDETGAFETAIIISVWLMIITTVAAYFLFQRIFNSKSIALFAFTCLWLTPLIPYLAGKILSENTSLFFVTLSLLSFTFIGNGKQQKIVYAVVAGTLMAFAVTMRIDSLFGLLGFFVAYAIKPIAFRGNYIKPPMMLVVACSFIIVYSSLFLVAGIEISNLISYFFAFVGAGQKPGLMSFQGIATVGGIVYIFSIFGFFSKEGRLTRFFTIWLIITAVPVLIISWNYMVEPRYLIQIIIPLCGLAALGMDKVFSLFDRCKKIVLALGLIIVISVVATNYVLVRLMPYELDRLAMLEAVNEIKEIDSNASILIPWSYADYNFLHLTLNDDKIYNVNSSVNSSLDKNVEAEWKRRFQLWYGEQYISEQNKVDVLLKKGPVYYLGWRIYPPVQNIRDFAATIGWQRLVVMLDNLQLKDHRKESWLWYSPEFNMQYSGDSGQYEYYRVQYVKDKSTAL